MRTTIFLAILTLCWMPVPSAQTLDEREQTIAGWVDQHQHEAIALLAETVNIGSGTMNHQGVRAVGDVMARELEALGLSPRWIDMPER